MDVETLLPAPLDEEETDAEMRERCHTRLDEALDLYRDLTAENKEVKAENEEFKAENAQVSTENAQLWAALEEARAKIERLNLLLDDAADRVENPDYTTAI
jgi:predicted nuclease with TOPRIM domain